MMPPVDRNAMPPAQRAAWDRLWKILLTPEEESTRAAEGLAATSNAGVMTDAETPDGRNDTADRTKQNAR
jgi:hypothetical protein